jgi:hypothetical protein
MCTLAGDALLTTEVGSAREWTAAWAASRLISRASSPATSACTNAPTDACTSAPVRGGVITTLNRPRAGVVLATTHFQPSLLSRGSFSSASLSAQILPLI